MPDAPTPTTPTTVDPTLAALIDELVERKVEARLEEMGTRVTDALTRLQRVEKATVADRTTLLVFSGDFDKLMSAFIVATGAAAMGMEVSMYFTFWGLTALKKQTIYAGKSVPEKMVSMMMPSGVESTPTSNMNMLGIGPVFFKHLMKNNNVATLPDLIGLARELGIKLIACQMAMGVMGITREELIDDIEYGGVATYIGQASDSKVTLFI